jgi:hyperosmotically inducible protein
MRTNIAITSFFAATLLLPTVVYSADTKTEAVKEAVGDAAITTKIKAAFVKDKQVSALNIKVDTDNKGMVMLSGTAKTQAEADRAAAIARETSGVTSVTNNIQVSPAAK